MLRLWCQDEPRAKYLRQWSFSLKVIVVDSNFAPGGATWRAGRNIHIVFDPGPLAPLCENMTSSQNSCQYTLIVRLQRSSYFLI